ncbi:leucine-rich repeat domain-containing protein [Polaribacter sp. IC073]|uniref:leucine-rich repeat domain-containing protein n=1 Tax=Polaribacter sp. IC073 TaxID=2508540 RepID=UPI0011BD8874|nr:leucine-rich repeat domain-containing protein [Polaribacter sp. IC073]TXD47328.1 hypothetical protein ES045_12075 [Polaribacter sp. IC073]
MATEQQIIDVKYDILQAEQEEKILNLFSPEILAKTNLADLKTFSEITSVTSLDFSNQGLSVLNGLGYLTSLNSLRLNSNKLTEINVSNLTNLTDLRLYNNQLTDIGNVSNLTNLTYLNISDNELTDIGNVSNLTNLTDLRMADNQLTDINVSNLTNLTYISLADNQLTDINVSNLTNLITLYVHRNSLITSAVDSVLSKCVSLIPSGKLTNLFIQGNAVPTNGASNQDYIDLVNAGITVIIQTS